MTGQPGAGITVGGTGQGLMNTEGFFAAPVGLARHIDDGDQGAFLQLVLIGNDDVIHRLGQAPAFEQPDFTMAGTHEPVVWIGHHGDEARGLFTHKSIRHFQRGRQTSDRPGIAAQGVEPVQAPQGIRTHERSP